MFHKLSQKFRTREAAMPFIMMAVLIDMAAIGIIIPVLPTLVGSFATTQADQAYWYGVVAVAFGVSNFLASPVLGALSDRYGRRPVLLLGFMGLGVSFFGTAMSTSLWGLMLARTLGGAMQANVAIANAYVADISVPEQRAKRFGLLGGVGCCCVCVFTLCRRLMKRCCLRGLGHLRCAWCSHFDLARYQGLGVQWLTGFGREPHGRVGQQP